MLRVDGDLPESDMFHDALHYFACVHMWATAVRGEDSRSEIVPAPGMKEEQIALSARLREMP